MADTGDTFKDYFERYGHAYRWIATITVVGASISTVLSATIVNVAVPQVMGSFGIGLDRVQWMATAFLATMTVSQLLCAWLLDCLGTRSTFVYMLMLFVAGALLGAAAPNIEIMALGRAMQGMAAGVIQPLSMVVLALVFPPERRGFAMGVYGMGVVLAPAIGPLAGGIAIDTLGWRYMFLMPLPLCAIALLAGANFLPGREAHHRPRAFDWPGVLLLATALVATLAALSNGQRWGWLSDQILLYSLTGAGAGAAFVYSQLKSTSPLLDFAVLANGHFASTCLIAFVFGSGLFATTYYIPVFVQTVLSFTPTQAGLLLAPAGLVLMVALPVAGRLADSVPAHYLIVFGLIVLGIGFMMMSGADANTSFWTLALIVMFGRAGMGFINSPLRTAATRVLPGSQLAQGSGTLNFFRQLGGAFGISALVIIVEQRTQFHAEALAATQTAANHTSRELLAKVSQLLSEAGLAIPEHQAGALSYLGEVVTAQAQSRAFNDAAIAIAVVFFLTVLPALLLARARTTA
ncbi:MAG: DHA2 family efflux MFS transporter permease subunit [Gammaproteobacteria bacterium]|nr:DHA2 family efflux MFS transporter permease subunit [Gammaproteobacteria bacterium]